MTALQRPRHPVTGHSMESSGLRQYFYSPVLNPFQISDGVIDHIEGIVGQVSPFDIISLRIDFKYDHP